MLIIRGDKYNSLWNYHKASEHRYRALKKVVFDLVTDSLRDALMNELLSYGQSNSKLCKQSSYQKKAPRDSSNVLYVKAGEEALIQVFMARVYVKRADREFKEFRKYVHNGYMMRSGMYLFDMIEANH